MALSSHYLTVSSILREEEEAFPFSVRRLDGLLNRGAEIPFFQGSFNAWKPECLPCSLVTLHLEEAMVE